MQDTSTSIDRLAKIISDKPKYNPNYKNAPPRREIHIGVAEGWFSLVLLATVVYSTVWCVQAADWVDHLNILTLTTFFGLVIGVVTAKQRRFPALLVHAVVLSFGLLLCYWQTAGAFYHGSVGAFTASVQHWLATAFSNNSGNDDAIFLFFIIALGFVLAYASAWLVYRTRNPWLMILANAIVLAINLSSVDAGYIIFLVVFLMASLLLLLRFNLYESVRRWRRQGLRYPDDIGWDIMQAGALISVGILIFSWLLPGSYTNAVAAQVWNSSSNPWQQAENTWNRLISLNGGTNPSNHGNFRDSLTLGGNPNLNHDTVLTFTVQGAATNEPVYLTTLNYDTYLKDRSTWTNNQTATQPLKANDLYPTSGFAMKRTITQKVTIVSSLNEEFSYVPGASDITAYNAPANVLFSKANNSVVAWVKQNGNFAAGTKYTITSTVSGADVQTLRSVPMPANAPQSVPPEYNGPPDPNVFDTAIVDAYTSLPALDPRILAKAKQIVNDAHAKTMYDKAVALETYFRSTYSYSTDIQRPAGEEAVSWFLFDNSDRKGFCNYFSSSMVVMARELGIPARVVAGYTNGTYDPKTRQYTVHGTDAHSWVQVYFAGYGWINFEPSASFATFYRPLPNQFSVSGTNGSTNGTSTNGGAIPPNQRGRAGRNGLDDTANSDSSGGAANPVQLRQEVGTALGSIVLLILFSVLLFSLWWRRLFRRYSLSSQLYGRLCVLANWAGIRVRQSQTPYEYIHGVAAVSPPQDTLILERLGDIYVRDKWADPESTEHPAYSGEIDELPSLWRQVQPHLFLYVLRHPSFLRWIPQRVGALVTTYWRKRRARKVFEEDL